MVINVFIGTVCSEWDLAHSKRPISVSYYCHASLSLVSSSHTATAAAELDGKRVRF